MHNIYIIGYHGSNCDFDPGAGTAIKNASLGHAMFIAKYDASGSYQWVKSFDHNGSDMDAVAMENNGTIVVVGRFFSTSDFDPDAGVATLNCAATYNAFIAKYNGSNGSYLQANELCATGGIYDLSAKADHIYLGSVFPLSEDSIDLAPGSQEVFHHKVADYNMYFAKYASNAASLNQESNIQQTIKVAPNPIIGNTLQVSTQQNTPYVVYDLAGRVLQHGSLYYGGNILTLTAPSGMYILTTNGSHMKILKE